MFLSSLCKPLLVVSFMLLVPLAHAKTFHYLSDPSLAGRLAGPDLLWDSGDELGPGEEIFPGESFNPGGHGSGFLFNNAGLFGSIGGSFETSGNSVISYDVTGNINSIDGNGALTTGDPLVEMLAAGFSSTFTVNNDNTATSDMVLNVSDGVSPGSEFVLFGDYSHFNNGDDHNVIFAGSAFDDLRAQIDFFLPLLPSDWETLFLGIETFVFFELFDEQGTQLQGNQGAVFYTTSADVPEPSALALIAFGFGLMSLRKHKRS